jgi:AIPR protein
MKKAAAFTFPVASFRHLETPFKKQKFSYKNYLSIVDVHDLPDFSSWRKINVRDPKLTGSVPKSIRESLLSNTELFVFMNRGIVVSVESVKFDNDSDELTITLSDQQLHGLLDGGHTYNIILDERDAIDGPQYVKLELLEGFSKDEIPMLVDARNTSNQVRDQSLMNLQGEFEKLKRAVKGQRYSGLIAYKEHEVMDDGSSKPIDVREVIAILTCFDRANFDARTHPINAYRSKVACLQHFSSHKADYEKIYPIAADVLRLYDEIQLQLPDLYNRVRGKSGDVAGGKFGKLTGVTTYNGDRQVDLLFIENGSKYAVPAGFVYPVLGAFRALLEEKDGQYIWGKSLNPLKLLQGHLGETLADTIGNFALDARNPSKTGKSPLVWQACYQAAQVAYLSR